jgi:uncharacterized protein YbaR (Trm112 family)/SAM-dependent methyltransferase
LKSLKDTACEKSFDFTSEKGSRNEEKRKDKVKYSTLDFISCPVDGHYPLVLSVTEVKGVPTTSSYHHVCELYCGYRNRSINGSTPSNTDCTECHARTIETGVLSCEQCGSSYLISHGIAKLIPDELKSQEEIRLLGEIGTKTNSSGQTGDSFVVNAKRDEMASRGKYQKDEVLQSYTQKRFDFMNRVEVETVSRYLDTGDGDIVLDAGAGYGVAAVPLSQHCRYVVATDITFEVLLALKQFFYGMSTSYFDGYSEFPEDRICLIQADMCSPPFRKGFQFTKVLSSQVLCHIPGDGPKESYIEGIEEHLVPGGTMVLTAFNYGLVQQLLTRLRNIPKEASLGPAEWAGYYYRFREDELRKLLNNSFAVDELIGFHSLLPRYVSLLSSGAANALERVTQATPFSRLVGHLLLAKCRKQA